MGRLSDLGSPAVEPSDNRTGGGDSRCLSQTLGNGEFAGCLYTPEGRLTGAATEGTKMTYSSERKGLAVCRHGGQRLVEDADSGRRLLPGEDQRRRQADGVLPCTEDELCQATALTERAVNAEGSQYDWVRAYFHFANGLAHYRRGRFDDAIAVMTGDASKAAEYMGPSPRLVRAMALYQKGQKDEARKLLAAAVLSYDRGNDPLDQQAVRKGK